jgi:hypothetical protein
MMLRRINLLTSNSSTSKFGRTNSKKNLNKKTLYMP